MDMTRGQRAAPLSDAAPPDTLDERLALAASRERFPVFRG
jgi:hypothetical protein